MKIKINGAEYPLPSDREMPLLWFLRDELGMTGTKFGCGKGLCGACTVVMDGVPIRSCSFPVNGVGKAEITTIEQTSDKKLQRLKEIWQRHKVPQCGYCQPGQIMNALGTLQTSPGIEEEPMITAMAGNICRCGTYKRILAAVLEAREDLGSGK